MEANKAEISKKEMKRSGTILLLLSLSIIFLILSIISHSVLGIITSLIAFTLLIIYGIIVLVVKIIKFFTRALFK